MTTIEQQVQYNYIAGQISAMYDVQAKAIECKDLRLYAWANEHTKRLEQQLKQYEN